MLKNAMAKSTAIAIACCISISAHAVADVKSNLDVPAGELIAALKTLASQSDVQLMYQPDQLRNMSTDGVKGHYSPQQAIAILLKGTPLQVRTDSTGAMVIVPAHSGNASSSDARPSSGGRDASPAENASNAAEVPAAKESQEPRGFWDRFRLAQANVASSASERSADGAGAQTKVEEVVVTAQKRSERLQDVPVPVSVLKASTLAENNTPRLQDYYASVPGFSVAPTPGAGGQQLLSIRGITTGSFTIPTVGVTVDDVPYGSSTSFAGSIIPDIDPSDLDRIEVLRGPQGTLYGASSMGGLLKFVTVDPSTDGFKGRVELGTNGISHGSDVGYNVRGSVNVPLSESFAIRASGFSRYAPGYIDNPFLGEKDVNDARVSGGRISALWRQSENLSVKLSALYQRDRTYASSQVTALPGLGEWDQNYIRGNDGGTRKTQAYSAVVNASFGGVTLTSITGYNVNDYFDWSDSTYAYADCCTAPLGYGVSGSPLTTFGSTKRFTEEMRLSVPLGQRVDLLLGAVYSHEDSPYTQLNYASDPLTGRIAAQTWYSTYPSKHTEYGEFADLTFHVSDRFDIQVGGRQSQIRDTFGPCVYLGPLFGDGGCARTPSGANPFTYLVTPRFRVSPDLMLYARAASGFRAGGSNVFNTAPDVPREYDPDETRNYELGAKGALASGVVTYDLSLYYIDFEDLQVNLLSTSNQLVYTTNGSHAKSAGVELSLEARPTDDLTLTAWGAYNEAELTEDMPARSNVVGRKGDRLPYGTRFSSTLSATQEFPLMREFMGFVGATVSYVGDRKGTFVSPSPTNPNPRETYPSYVRADLRAGLRHDEWLANLYVNNVTDKRGLIGGGNGTYPPFAFTYIQPRTFGVSVSRSF